MDITNNCYKNHIFYPFNKFIEDLETLTTQIAKMIAESPTLLQRIQQDLNPPVLPFNFGDINDLVPALNNSNQLYLMENSIMDNEDQQDFDQDSHLDFDEIMQSVIDGTDSNPITYKVNNNVINSTVSTSSISPKVQRSEAIHPKPAATVKRHAFPPKALDKLSSVPQISFLSKPMSDEEQRLVKEMQVRR